jgi:parallel beta-helix repeat protein
MRRERLILCTILVVLVVIVASFSAILLSVERPTYIIHAPIYIRGDANFTASNGVTSGRGTASDPYIIQGWEIETSGTNGIIIFNTSAHFVITNVFLRGYELNAHYQSVVIDHATNGTITNCTLLDSIRGISVSDSSDITIRDNNCTNDCYSIYLESSNNNTIYNNTCGSNISWHDRSFISLQGITLSSSSNNTISNNYCSNNMEGVRLESSNNNILSDNILYDNYEGIILNSSSGNAISRNLCTFGGIVIYSSNMNALTENTVCHSNFDGMIISRSNNNFIDNNACLDTDYGMLLYSSSNNTISRNNCSDSRYGIYIDTTEEVIGGPHIFSYFNSIFENRICNNTHWGIYIGPYTELNVSASPWLRNSIWNNTFIGNNYDGIIRNASATRIHIQACDDELGNSWNSSDGYGNYWSDWTTPDDTPPSGIVDLPYEVEGMGGAKDYRPRTLPPDV